MKDNKKHNSTHYIHRMNYSAQERMVGVFVLSAISVLVFLLFSAIKSQNIFEDYMVIYGKLNSAEGLSTETIVQISGIEVGKVSAVDITDENKIMLTMNVYKRYQRLLRVDSKIKVSSLNATIIGKSFIEITAGSHDKDMLHAGAMLDIQESGSVEDVIVEAKSLLNVIKKMVHNVSDVIAAVDAKKIASMIESFDNMASNLDSLTHNINQGKGAVGSLVSNERMQKDISTTIDNFKQSSDDLKSLIKILKNNAGEVPEVLNNINSVVGETEKTILATQKIWPISTVISNSKSSNKTVDPQPAND